MISKLVSKLQSHRRTKITLAVREKNLTAQLFFRAQNFRSVKVLRGFYEDSGEDAFLMKYSMFQDSEDFEDNGADSPIIISNECK